MLRIGVFVVAALCLTGAPIWAQAIQLRIPAHSALWGYADGTGESLVVVGVPGERSVIRLKPRPPFDGGFKLTLLEAGQPLREWSGAPHEMLSTDPIEFGDDGAVAVVVQHLGPGGGGYVLFVSSKLPAGSLRPEIEEVEVDGHGGNGFATTLRPGLDLRVKLRRPDLSGVFPIVPPDYTAHMELAPIGAGLPSIKVLATPAYPFPSTWKHTYEPSGLTQVTYGIGLHETFIRARVRRERQLFDKPCKPAKGPSAGCQFPAQSPLPVQLDTLAVQAGGAVVLSSAFCKPWCANVGEQDIATVWLASPHADGDQPLAGVQLGEGLGLTWRDWGATVEGELFVPVETEPGLYLIQLRPGAAAGCEWWTKETSTEVPLLVLGS